MSMSDDYLPMATQPPKAKPERIKPEDRLRAENLMLKLQNVQLQLQVMQADLAKALGSRQAIQLEMEKLRKEFLEIYGVDLATINIADDGTYSTNQLGSMIAQK